MVTRFKISCTPDGRCWSVSGGIIIPPLKGMVSHRWKVLLAMQASEMSLRRVRARSPRGPPRLRRTTSFPTHTLAMIFGVRASAPNKRREKQASLRARVRQSSGSLRAKTAVRFKITRKSSRSMLRRERSLGSVSMLFARTKPKNQLSKHMKLILFHGTVGTTNGVKFSIAFWCAAVANGGGGGACGKDFREENVALMEVKVFVGDVIT